MNIEIIADNGGGITLQNDFGDYVFYYDGRDGFKHLAKDIFELFSDSESIKSFDGNNPIYYISDEYFENNKYCYKIIFLEDILEFLENGDDSWNNLISLHNELKKVFVN